ncbi:hypothetical protein LJC46_05155 [Desulfovibrio sp. OttesenSCG-928-G15]|nr:hypothetical protein [Desulfovibrio sp. OttesenSCG-928-G15]
MYKYTLCLLCCIALLLASGCVAKRVKRGGEQSPDKVVEELSFSAATPPEGMRLGQSYVSALNEPCYEAFPVYGATPQPQAYCQRAGGWTLLPNMYMTVPHSGNASYTQ